LSELYTHCKGAKSAKASGVSLAVERNGKRKGSAARNDQADLKAYLLAFRCESGKL
jgi:hypothetical protein